VTNRYVQILTDEGVTGTGETFYGAETVEAHIHETAAPLLLGHDPLRIAAHGRALEGYVGYSGSGAEMRARSAIDIALWDLRARAAGLPLHDTMGGRTRDSIRIYNTCAGSQYVRKNGQSTKNWGLHAGIGQYEDLQRFLTDAMDVMIELHSLWNTPTAQRIVSGLAPYQPFWVEDPVRADVVGGLAAVSRTATAVGTMVAAGETVATAAGFMPLLNAGAVDVVTVDLTWCGGITEAVKIAALAEASGRAIAPHDCTGPLSLTAATHLSVSAPNALVQETVRAATRGWYGDLVTQLPTIENGTIRPPEGVGLGTELQPDVRSRDGSAVHISR
jgi:galactonate dehydratase